jgi:hypothetical protein
MGDVDHQKLLCASHLGFGFVVFFYPTRLIPADSEPTIAMRNKAGESYDQHS